MGYPVFATNNVNGVWQGINLNNGWDTVASTHSLFNSPEQEIKLADTVYGTPYMQRTKMKERVFSITITLLKEAYSDEYNEYLSQIKKFLYFEDGVRLFVWRRGVGWIYNDCNCEGIEQLDSVTYEAKFTAADPTFIAWGSGQNPTQGGSSGSLKQLLADAITSTKDSSLITGRSDSFDPALSKIDEDGKLRVRVGTGKVNTSILDAGSDESEAETQLVTVNLPYPGSTRTQPNINFQINTRGGRWRYHKIIAVQNRSPEPLTYYPVCIDLGNIASLVGNANYAPHIDPGSGKKYFVDGPAGVSTTVGYPIKDIRVESEGGARKTIWIRDKGGSLHDHTSVKVWTTIFTLSPGQTKNLRVLYGNYRAYLSDISPEQSSIRPMFNGYTSVNERWDFNDFMPQWNQPQTRAGQWASFSEGATTNIEQLRSYHPLMDNQTSEAVVPAAGGRATFYGPGSGAAGHQFASPVGIWKLEGTYKMSTNHKMPLYGRAIYRDGSVGRTFAKPELSESFELATRHTLSTGYSAGATSLVLAGGTDMSAMLNTDYIVVTHTDGTQSRYTLTNVNTGTRTLTLASGLLSAASAGGYVTFGRNFTFPTFIFPSTNPARNIIFFVRAEGGPNNMGDWYVGGIDYLQVYFQTTEYPLLTTWGSATEVDLFNVGQNGYQLRGRFGNSLTGEYLHINTITRNIMDKVVVDCQNRTCTYYPWTGGGYGPGENRFEAITFPTVGKYWISLKPTYGVDNDITFVNEPNSYFTELDVTIEYPVRYL
jgi:hypothetical protein